VAPVASLQDARERHGIDPAQEMVGVSVHDYTSNMMPTIYEALLPCPVVASAG